VDVSKSISAQRLPDDADQTGDRPCTTGGVNAIPAPTPTPGSPSVNEPAERVRVVGQGVDALEVSIRAPILRSVLARLEKHRRRAQRAKEAVPIKLGGKEFAIRLRPRAELV